MPQPLIVSIPHNLGKDEAIRRLKSGLAGALSSILAEAAWARDAFVFLSIVRSMGP